MADGQGTHATQNRLTMYRAVEAALAAVHDLVPDYGGQRQVFLSELTKRGHVVGHVTDRHHELQSRCAELLAKLDARIAEIPDHGGDLGHGYRDALTAVATHPAAVAIRAIVANPLRPAGQPTDQEPDPRGPRLVPRRNPELCWRIHPGTEGSCQLPDGHDL